LDPKPPKRPNSLLVWIDQKNILLFLLFDSCRA
jgi:hypothetical protein